MQDPIILHGDCLAVLPTLADNSIDAIITDPPYALSFMGRHWDSQLPPIEIWRECYRILKPGGHIAVFGGSRTHHRIWCAIEDAGFEIRDTLMWLHGSGFPKGANISKQIDKLMGCDREVVGNGNRIGMMPGRSTLVGGEIDRPIHQLTAPSSAEAKQWDGWNTQLKPSHEPICLARKPISEKTVAENVLKWGTGAINVDACRVDGAKPNCRNISFRAWRKIEGREDWQEPKQTYDPSKGRYPANTLHDGSDEVLDAFFVFGETKSATKHGNRSIFEAVKGVTTGASFGGVQGGYNIRPVGEMTQYGDQGSPARFFYCSKASKADRCGSKHPTVKPLRLMDWLVKLITPRNGTVLDPFAGSGTTGSAAIANGHACILIEREAEYIVDIERRLSR